ncbi:MAG: hypothetical protein ACC700_15150 [Anaerolineales bacterium]
MIQSALAQYLFEKLIVAIPRRLARVLLSLERVASQVVIDLGSANPIDISFGSSVPNITISFRISNMSPGDLQLDRLLVDLWIGQPTLQAAILHIHKIPRREEKELYLKAQLSGAQQGQIRREVRNGFLPRLTIYVDTYLASKVGMVHMRKHFERSDVVCKLPSAPSP